MTIRVSLSNVWAVDNVPNGTQGSWAEASAVPEPAMLWLLAAGLCLVIVRVRIRQRQSSNVEAIQ
jgi:hypothetical protein